VKGDKKYLGQEGTGVKHSKGPVRVWSSNKNREANRPLLRWLCHWYNPTDSRILSPYPY